MDEYSEILHFVFGPNQHRQGLARLVENLFTWPIHDRRWRVVHRDVRAVLREKAHAYGTDEPFELLRAARATFTAVLPTMGPIIMDGMDYDQRSFRAWSRELRRKITRQITEDLLGSDWRKPRAHVREALPDVTHGPERDTAVEIHTLLSHEKLSVAEREAFRAFLACDGDRAAAAQRLGITTNAFDLRFARVCRKCRDGYRAR